MKFSVLIPASALLLLWNRCDAGAPTPVPTSLNGATLVSFPYTGSVQTFTVPANVIELTVTLVGASGGNVAYSSVSAKGGRGALITSTMPVTPGEVLQIFVGGAGTQGSISKTGGFNGGGDAIGGPNYNVYIASGGGGTDIRSSPYGINDRKIVAGGGGASSGGCPKNGGNAGYPNGFPGVVCSAYAAGQGGTQSSGGAYGDSSGTVKYGTNANNGALFSGGQGVANPAGAMNTYGGGGGGGYYGGGGTYASGAGGGSSYSAYTITETIDGAWEGDGKAWISYEASITTDAPTVNPTTVPTARPSTPSPSANPTTDPTASPTMNPTTDPTATPTLPPTTSPSATPTMDPSADPTANPSATPTADPTASPSTDPTTDPTASPSVIPTVSPSAIPTAHPTANPTAAPTLSPTASPSAIPTADPTADPTIAPTAAPTLLPTASPSTNPTVDPTASPTFSPTDIPSALPTARPTRETMRPYEVVLGIEQDVYFINKADYDAQIVECNLTIQHTVASSLEGVIPERVTDIEVKTRNTRANVRALASSVLPPVLLRYKVVVFDPFLSPDVLKRQLLEKVLSQQMDATFRNYARVFNATKMENGTFAVPKITVLNKGHFEDPLNSGEAVGLVFGVLFFLLALTVGVFCMVRWLQNLERVDKGESTV